jgi:hypothetical protein
MQSHTQGMRTLVAIDANAPVPATLRGGARIVRTPLDLIRAFDEPPDVVVLAGSFARDGSYAVFIRELAPECEVIALAPSEDRPHEAGVLCYA